MCVCLGAFGPATVWLGPHAQNAVQTSTQKKGKEEEERGIEQEAN